MRFSLLLFYLVSSVLATNFTIKIDPMPVRTLSDKFLSFSIDSYYALPDLWKQIDFRYSLKIFSRDRILYSAYQLVS